MRQVVDAGTGGIAGWVVSVVDGIGEVGVGALIALENLFPPIPSEVILPLAGFAAAQGSFSLLSAILWTTAGSVVGALVLYELGAVVGRDRVRAFAARLPLVNPGDVDVAERWFVRHGYKAVFFGRMLPIIRSAISVPAGVERMPMWRFLLYTLAGSAIWNTLFIVAGYQLGARYTEVEQYATTLQYVVVAVAVALVGWFVVARIVKRQRAHPDVPVPDED